MWTAIPTFTNGQKITSSMFYRLLRDNLRFLYQPPQVRTGGTGDQTILSAAPAMIDFQNTIYDNDGMHGGEPMIQNEPASGLLTVQTAGVYMHCARVDLQWSATGVQFITLAARTPPATTFAAYAYKTTTYANSGGPHTVHTTEMAYLYSADMQMAVLCQPSDDTAGIVIAEYNMPLQYAHWMKP